MADQERPAAARKKAASKKKAQAGVREPESKQPSEESRTDKPDGDELDQEAAAGLDAIAREGERIEEKARAAELEESTATEFPYDRQLAEALKILNAAVFMLAAGRGGAHWKLSEQEAQELSKAEAQCIERYIGSVNFGPAVSLVFVTSGIVAPRLAQTAHLRAQAEKAQQQRQQEGGEHGTH